MATSTRAQAILASVKTEFDSNAYTHETVAVTKTATMVNGSLLVGALETAIAAQATANGILDFPQIENYAVGAVMPATVAKRSVVANTSVIKNSDGAATPASLTALIAAGVVFKATV